MARLAPFLPLSALTLRTAAAIESNDVCEGLDTPIPPLVCLCTCAYSCVLVRIDLRIRAYDVRICAYSAYLCVLCVFVRTRKYLRVSICVFVRILCVSVMYSRIDPFTHVLRV